MTYEQFWDGDVEMAKAYREAYRIKKREENQQAWLQGAYVYHAIGALAPVLKAFAKGSAKPYMEHPFGYEEEAKEQPKEQTGDRNALSWMEMWAINFNQKFDEKNQKKGGDADGDDGKH